MPHEIKYNQKRFIEVVNRNYNSQTVNYEKIFK